MLYVSKIVPHQFHVGVIFIEAILDVVILLTLAFIGALAVGSTHGATAVLSVLAILVVVLISSRGVFSHMAIRFKLEDATRVFRLLRVDVVIFSKVIFLTLLAWSMTGLFVLIVFYAFGLKVLPTAVLFAPPIVTLGSLVPISIGGIGLREGIMLVLYGYLENPSVVLSVAAYYSFVSVVLYPLLCMPLYFAMLRKSRENIAMVVHEDGVVN